MHQWKAAEAVKLQKLVDARDIVLRTQAIQLRDLERQVEELRRSLSDQRALEDEIRARHVAETTARERERALATALAELQVSEGANRQTEAL
ncbi:hypothetical protein PINS_up010788 [Pythium insidiosum]|nr:hypothetical protein PINS_up010788 [Pythium insidiosum]